ncbi:MAG: hypothetical protein DRI84_05160 [Bacteroidetes bacterium]|nr:MAG: hypothetical protein DRI84_05160 [Bacteroidota bacterium]
MKKIILAVFIALSSFGVQAQSTNEIEMMQALFGAEKMLIVAEFVKPDSANAQAFETLYNEYEVERKELGKISITLLNEYAEKWNGMTDEQADEWMKKVLDVSAKRDKLIRTYYKKIKKATTAIIATQFYQVETYILTSIRSALYESIPFVGEKK